MRYIFTFLIIFLLIPIVVGVFTVWYYFVEFICDISGVSEIYIDLPMWIAILFPIIFGGYILPYIKNKKIKNIPTDNNSNEKKNSSSYIDTEKRKKRKRDLLLKKIIEEKSK
ncbi:MAG: hypothetical protein ACJ0PS_00460 [Flavobacteriaceae bacterium]